jgi:hypothetical protein
VSDIPSGRVYLALTFYGPGPDDDYLRPRWAGYQETDEGIEAGPEFADAGDAVRWWRERGAEWILIRIDATEHLWAGTGPQPVDNDGPIPEFSFDDPRGRPEGAMKSARAAREDNMERQAADEVRLAFEEGARLKRRREGVGLSVVELATRIGVDPSWIESVESGRATSEVTMSQWVDLVWATREPWPDDRRHQGQMMVGWVGESLVDAEDIVRLTLESGT